MTVFADACYWIAVLNPKDSLHQSAQEASDRLGPTRIVTSQMVLAETLNGLSGRGEPLRAAAVKMIGELERSPNVGIVPQTSLQFHSAMRRYDSRRDKEWGLTDCSSFLIMEEKGLTDALTGDRHFEQAGFAVLMKQDE